MHGFHFMNRRTNDILINAHCELATATYVIDCCCMLNHHGSHTADSIVRGFHMYSDSWPAWSTAKVSMYEVLGPTKGIQSERARIDSIDCKKRSAPKHHFLLCIQVFTEIIHNAIFTRPY